MSPSNTAGREVNNDRLPAFAADLVRRRVDVIATPGSLLRHWPQNRRLRQFRSFSMLAATRSSWAGWPASIGQAATSRA